MISIQKEATSFCGKIGTNFQIGFILRIVEGPVKILQVFIAFIVGITRKQQNNHSFLKWSNIILTLFEQTQTTCASIAQS